MRHLLCTLSTVRHGLKNGLMHDLFFFCIPRAWRPGDLETWRPGDLETSEHAESSSYTAFLAFSMHVMFLLALSTKENTMLMSLFMIVPPALVSLSRCLSENILFKLNNRSKPPAQSLSTSNQKLLQSVGKSCYGLHSGHQKWKSRG